MSTERVDNGGPAFPVEVSGGPDGFLVGRQTGSCSGYAMGLSIRDYFAAKAMQGWMATYSPEQPYATLDATEVANLSYRIADAMLKARGEKQPPLN